MRKSNAFTFIELLITLSVVAICFLPLMQMFSASLEEVSNTGNLSCGRYLVQEGMERLKNLGFTEAQVEAQGDLWEPGLDKGPLELNGKYWRTLRKVVKGSDPLEVHILAYQETLAKEESAVENAPRSLVLEAATLLEDLDWST